MSGPKTAEEVLGFEFDWLACDRDGHVALFTTAGGGYAPAEFLRDVDVHAKAIEAVLSMARTTSAVFAPTVGAGCTNTWKLVAERGLYAYDSSPHGDPYELVAMPVEAVPLAELPAAVQAVVRRVRLETVRFDTETILDVAKVMQDEPDRV